VDSETDWKDGIAVIGFEDDNGGAVQAALRLSDDGSALTVFERGDELPDDAPADLDLGLFFLKITVPTPGNATTVRLYFSDAVLDEDSRIYKYDTAAGWYDYTAYTEISEDFSCLTLELVDGGYGDADGVANGVIIDPVGTSTTVDTADVDTGDTDGDTDSGDTTVPSSGGGGCFISSLF
jgi:hypothetical protein